MSSIGAKHAARSSRSASRQTPSREQHQLTLEVALTRKGRTQSERDRGSSVKPFLCLCQAKKER